MSIEVFYKLRLIKREEADNAIAFLSIIIKVKYNVKYLTLNLKEKNDIFLKLHYRYSILGLLNRKLSQ